MDDAVLTALKKWPDVPACYGWVRLDARGQWHLGNPEEGGPSERVRHAGLATFLERNCAANERGEWFVQNGPQRAYITLDATPMIARYLVQEGGQQTWQTHTKQTIDHLISVRLDEHGRLYLAGSHGVALVDDRDLPQLLDQLYTSDGRHASEAELAVLLDPAQPMPPLYLRWQDQRLPLQRSHSESLADEFGFTRHPGP